MNSIKDDKSLAESIYSDSVQRRKLHKRFEELLADYYFTSDKTKSKISVRQRFEDISETWLLCITIGNDTHCRVEIPAVPNVLAAFRVVVDLTEKRADDEIN